MGSRRRLSSERKQLQAAGGEVQATRPEIRRDGAAAKDREQVQEEAAFFMHLYESIMQVGGGRSSWEARGAHGLAGV